MNTKALAKQAVESLGGAQSLLRAAVSRIDFEAGPSHEDPAWKDFERAMQAVGEAVTLLKAARSVAWAHHASAFTILSGDQ